MSAKEKNNKSSQKKINYIATKNYRLLIRNNTSKKIMEKISLKCSSKQVTTHNSIFSENILKK